MSNIKRFEEHAEESRLNEELVSLLKESMPFRVVSEQLLNRIAELAKRASYDPGEVIYHGGDPSADIYIVVSGSIEHTLTDDVATRNSTRTMQRGDVFGWAALLKERPARLARTTSLTASEVVLIDAQELVQVLDDEPVTANTVMSRFATMITKDFAVPEDRAQMVKPRRAVDSGMNNVPTIGGGAPMTGTALTMFRLSQWLRSPRPYLMFIGFGILFGFWFLATEVWRLPRFREMPGLTVVWTEWLSKDPVYGLSIYVPEYYTHIWVSIRRVLIAFALATALGVPLGLFLGWSTKFKEYVFPVFETLRPIPVLAWVPLAILMFSGLETPVIFLTFLASFYATALNTMLGVQSIDESYSRAAYCLGANDRQVFRHIVIPGAMPFIFTGLQISIGVAWFSLVAAEMVSGQYGLGYVINTSYTMVRYPTIVIGMITLGVIGYITSAMVRILGDYLMQWRVRELALGEQH
jgi:NitT/TauT family transport system permease protein